MKAFGFSEYGAPTVFQEIDKEIKDPKPDQVQIEVMAFGINPYDILLRQGQFKEIRPLKFPFVPGTDLVGQVVKVGDEVTNFKVGDYVINYRPSGAYGERVNATADKVVKRPRTLSFLDAASLPTPGIAAYNAWHHFADVKDGDVIGIAGVTGLVGSLLAQMAKSQGHEVIGSASAANVEYAKWIGVDRFIAYDEEQDRSKFESSADVVFDATLGGHDDGLSDSLVKPGGQIVLIPNLKYDVKTPDVKVTHLIPGQGASNKEALEYWVELSKTWGVSIRVQNILKFTREDVVKAHELIEAHHSGKTVIQIERAHRTSFEGQKHAD
ncbi:NADPH--quinone reductase [Secundilactobacillus oryzae JCM 18671]|uniref:NADPH--quinone reductase n=1 Tax=Secundilactobacillus oryzae JCM 18671 TaxID=1291743 RepID=A0A081BGI4_9LACO|nr:NADP-dependent oxidoreductase [Secundilactobacillus oryzae]GAK47152.1 NADPH--quinone reductase [Secundilactobacillus oryzae JCM 18671]